MIQFDGFLYPFVFGQIFHRLILHDGREPPRHYNFGPHSFFPHFEFGAEAEPELPFKVMLEVETHLGDLGAASADFSNVSDHLVAGLLNVVGQGGGGDTLRQTVQRTPVKSCHSVLDRQSNVIQAVDVLLYCEGAEMR